MNLINQWLAIQDRNAEAERFKIEVERERKRQVIADCLQEQGASRTPPTCSQKWLLSISEWLDPGFLFQKSLAGTKAENTPLVLASITLHEPR